MAVPAWLTVLAWISLLVALVCAIWVIVDLHRHPQPMKIMNLVWPITMLWAGPIGIWGYRRMGRPQAIMKQQGKSMDNIQMPAWHSTFKGATHCGSGCTLGDIVAETFTLAVPLSLFGHHVFGTWRWISAWPSCSASPSSTSASSRCAISALARVWSPR